MQPEIRNWVPHIYGGNSSYASGKVIFINVLPYAQMQSIIMLSKKTLFITLLSKSNNFILFLNLWFWVWSD